MAERLQRILFVDDEPLVLLALQCRLRPRRNQWDMVFVGGAERALTELRSAPFDVLVSDIRMPGMDGAELLEHVREQFPHVVRILLSGQAERAMLERARKVCHEFLAKPCDGDVLGDALTRACRLRARDKDSTAPCKHFARLCPD